MHLTFGNTSKADISHTAFPFLVFVSSSVGHLQEFGRVPLRWKDLFVTYTYWYTQFYPVEVAKKFI